ncbi:MAG: hypothetical protein M8835_03395 [marine benthic group bacterium]|nr:hypothetical protein [Gemmatimonadota bacterium]
MGIIGGRISRPGPLAQRIAVSAALATVLLLFGPSSRLAAQEPVQEATPPVVDTIIVVRNNVFTEEQAASSGIFRAANSIHFVTKEWLIRDYLQFEAGQPYDSAQVAESERRLRAKNLFRELSIDSLRLEDGRLAVRVETRDGWSLKPKFALSVASTGEWTGTLGINDINLLGTGNQVYVAYVKEIDRDGLNMTLDFDRMFSSEIDLLLNHAGLSDGKNSNWVLGAPFRNNETTRSLEWDGSTADQDVFRYRNEVGPDATTLDTTIYRRDALVNNLTAGLATRHSPNDYLRFAVTGGVRSETFRLPDSVGVATEDSIYGTVGGWAEFSSANYLQLRRFNGFGTEDLDLSNTVRLTATLAPDAFGWQGTGVGLGFGAAAGTKAFGGRGWGWSSIDANYQWGGVAQDSGRVVFNVAAGYKPAERHSTAIQVQLGRLWNQKPGDEFDLGFASAPRGWPAHAFVGDQMWWASLEHRLYAVDEFLGLFGLGFGAFVDYGGAWYDDQEARTGGSAGIGLRLGSALSTVARTGRMDFAFNFGSGRDAAGVDSFTFVLGAGFAFPRRPIPVISYRAVQPQ